MPTSFAEAGEALAVAADAGAHRRRRGRARGEHHRGTSDAASSRAGPPDPVRIRRRRCTCASSIACSTITSWAPMQRIGRPTRCAAPASAIPRAWPMPRRGSSSPTEWLDGELKGRTWAAGEAFTLADCAAAPSLFYADWVHPIAERFGMPSCLSRAAAEAAVLRARRRGSAALQVLLPARRTRSGLAPCYLPTNTGLRFSTKACTASLWSAVRERRHQALGLAIVRGPRSRCAARRRDCPSCGAAPPAGPSASDLAKAKASSCSLASSTTRLTRPMRSQRSASTFSDGEHQLARPHRADRARQQPGDAVVARQADPGVAGGARRPTCAAMRMSQASAMARPAPAAAPGRAAMVGLRTATSAPVRCVWRQRRSASRSS